MLRSWAGWPAFLSRFLPPIQVSRAHSSQKPSLPPLPPGPGWNHPSSGLLQHSVLSSCLQCCLQSTGKFASFCRLSPCQAALFLRPGHVSSCLLMTYSVLGVVPGAREHREEQSRVWMLPHGAQGCSLFPRPCCVKSLARGC